MQISEQNEHMIKKKKICKSTDGEKFTSLLDWHECNMGNSPFALNGERKKFA